MSGNEENAMKRPLARGVRFLMFLPVGIVVMTLVVLVVESLWNWLMPELFGWKTITFWQTLGLLFLSRLLLGGFRGFRGRSPRGPYWRRRMRERWEQMTPEERERFRARLHEMGGHCGSYEPPPAEGGVKG
jgi:hypothetical protein